jgi:hypothetical protein
MVSEIRSTKRQAEEHKHDHDRQWKIERCWQKGEVASLTAAALVGLIAILVGNSASDKQRSVMQNTLDEMRVDRRAWVTADVNLSNDITYDPVKNIINVPLSFQIRNTGKTPAIYVYPNVKPFPLPTDVTPAIIKLCRLGMKQGNDIFPGEIRKFQQQWPYEISSETFKEEFNNPHVTSLNNLQIMPHIAVCITYQMPEDKDWYYTPMSVVLNGPNGAMHISAERPINASEVSKTLTMLPNISAK